MKPMDTPWSSPESTELVLTVPENVGVDAGTGFRARSTLGVLVELVSQAQKGVILGAPFVQEHEALLRGPVGLAIEGALGRGVKFDLITTDQTLLRETFDTLRRSHARSIRILRAPSTNDDRAAYFSHAKFCVQDETSAYIGSANFTRNGIIGNFEMGLLIHGKLVRDVRHIFEILLREGLLTEVL